MADELGLRLSAQVDDWIKSLARAAASADGLLKTVIELERSVKAAFQGIEAAARQSAGKAAGAFVASARVIDEATGRIETDAKNTSKALGGVAVAADKTAKSVAKSADELGKASGGVARGAAAAASNTTSALAGVDSSFAKISGRLRDGIFSIQTAIVGLGAMRFGQEAVGAASDFGQAIAYVGTVLNDTDIPMEKYRQQVIDLGGSTAQNAVERAKTLYQILSSGIPATEGAAGAGAVLETTLKAATAGMANAEDAAKAITGTMNAYAQQGLTAAQASDVLFQTVNRGVVEFPELARLFGQVSGVASSLGVALPEVGAAIATITKAGIPAESAVSGLRQAILSIAKPPENVQKALKEMGIEFGTAALESKGFSGVLKEVIDKTGGGADAMTKLFTDVDGLKAVLALTRGGLTGFNSDIAALTNSAGSTDKAFTSLSQTFAFHAEVAKNKIGTALIQIGEKILPTVAEAMGKLADYAEKNGAQIADSIGKAVDALAAFGAWVVDYGPTVLTWFAAFKGVSFFAGLTKDIMGAVGALKTLNQGFAASQSIGGGLAALGGTAGGAFTGGFSAKLKGLGGTLKAAFSSPGVLGVAATAATIGYTIGTELMEALGDAIEAGTQREIVAAIDDLDRQISARLKDLGARSVDEAAAIRRSIVTGQAVQTAPGKIQTLAEVQATGGTAATTAAFNKGLAAIAAEVTKAQAGTAASVARMQEAAAKIEDLQRSKGSAAEIQSAEAAFAEYTAVVQANAKRVEDLTNGSKALVAQYTEVTQAAASAANAQGTAAAKVGAGASKAIGTAAEKTQADLDAIGKDIIAFYERENAKLEDLRLRAIQSGAEAAQNEADARRAAFEAETDARIDALTAADAAEKKSAEFRAERERAATSIIDDQIAAMERMAKARIEEARSAAAAETKAFAESADIQRGIAEQLARDEAQIQAELAARTEEIRKASGARIAAADRALAAARLAEATRNAQRAADVERESSIQGRAETLVAGLTDSAQGGMMAQGIGNQIKESAGPGVLGDLAQQGGLIVGTIAGIGAAIAKLPDILNGIAGFLTTGLDEFAGALFESILNVLVSLAEGLPAQLDTILTQTVPAFIEALIAALPSIIGNLIILLPRIVVSLAKSIAVALPVAIYDGIVKAGEAIFDFLVSGMVQRIGEGIYDAFAAAGAALVDAIVAVFKPIIEFFKNVGEETGNFFSDLFGGGGNGVGAFIGRTTGTSALGKIAQGNFGDLGVEDIPLIGGVAGLFHQGGMVNSPSSPHAAAAMAMAGAPRFASGGMVAPIASLARRRLAQVLGGDDVPALLAPGEGVLTARGVEAAGGPSAVESLNRGNDGGAQSAQIVLSTRVGGDAALAAMLTRFVSISVQSASGNVRMAMDQAQRATRVPAFRPVR